MQQKILRMYNFHEKQVNQNILILTSFINKLILTIFSQSIIIKYRLAAKRMMKPTLKDEPQQSFKDIPSSKSTHTQKRVSFRLDSDTHSTIKFKDGRHNWKMSWTQFPNKREDEQRPSCEQYLQKYIDLDKTQEFCSVDSQIQAQIQPSFFPQENQFRKQNIEWDNFILIHNKKCDSSNFLCGKCSAEFKIVIQFVFHCLEKCGQIHHINCSHFIFEKSDWEQLQLQKPQNDRDIDINYKEISAQTKLIGNDSNQVPIAVRTIQNSRKQPSRQTDLKKEKQRAKILKKMNEIVKFTKKTIKAWKQYNLATNFIFGQHYYTLYNMVILLNPNSKDQSKQLSQCPKCPVRFATYRIFFLRHYKQNCSRINTSQSRYFILSAPLFYEYLYQSQKYSIKQVTDLSFIAYLYEQTPVSKQIDKNYPQFKYYVAFIKIEYHLFDEIQLNCPFCQFSCYIHLSYSYCHVRTNHPKQLQLHLGTICNNNSTKKIHLYKRHLKDEKMYCLKHSSNPMSYIQFINHLEVYHPKGIHVRLSHSLKS